MLVGLNPPDDAAIWRMDESRALVVTADFFTPVVDDAYDYGAISAANSLSDVYAMGGEPFLALNLAALPPNLPAEIGGEILRGGAEKAREAGVVIVGGHTIQDKEPKFGLVVIGQVHPQKIITKGGLQAGDHLILSKPLGMGVTTTAIKRGQAREAEMAEAIRWMKTLNRKAGALAREFSLRGGTDITGFGLLGHGLEMAQASGLKLEIAYAQLPFLAGAPRLARAWCFPGGAADNRLFVQAQVAFHGQSEEQQMLLFDPQTSGGLLLGVPESRLEAFLERARATALPLWDIGRAVPGSGIAVF